MNYYESKDLDRFGEIGQFRKSVESLRLLNEQGYGKSDGRGLTLNLVYNHVGAFLPAPQESLERQFKKELEVKFGVVFNGLFTITNMPINRFKKDLERLGAYDEYVTRLVNAFNPAAARGVMCRSLISVGHDGSLYEGIAPEWAIAARPYYFEEIVCRMDFRIFSSASIAP